jgi:subtilisin family serine protease
LLRDALAAPVPGALFTKEIIMRTTNRSLWAVLAALLLAVMAVLPALALTSSSQAEAGISLHLRIGTFDPLAAEPPDVPNSLATESTVAGTGYYAVQFQGPIRVQWREQLESTGAQVVEYVPDYAYVVRIPATEVARLSQLAAVRWVGPWQPAYRLHPDLLTQVEAWEQGLEATETAVEVRLATFTGVALESILANVRSLGLEPSSVAQSDWGATLRLWATPDALASLAGLPDVRWIEPYVEFQLFNERSQANWLLSTQAVWQGLGLYGQGQVVGVADTGLDTGNFSTVHQDVRGRVDQAFALGRPGNWSDPNGHGTHVAGSVLGNGVLSGSSPGSHAYAGSKAGSAPEARLVMQSVLDSGGGLGLSLIHI